MIVRRIHERLALLAALAATIVAGCGRQDGERAGAAAAVVKAAEKDNLRPVTIDYPSDESIFPPEFAPPTFLWHDAAQTAVRWRIDVDFADGSAGIHSQSQGAPPKVEELDNRCRVDQSELHGQTGYAIGAHSWRPDEETWTAIKSRSVERPATVTITGLADRDQPVSRGHVGISVSRDPVGAPIFYRDVPLMPAELEKGVIKPLAKTAIPLIGWRLRSIDQPKSRLLLEGMHSCANCHSFAADGKTLGMDLDGPENSKALYALAPVRPQMSIRQENVISWAAISEKTKNQRGTALRLGFLSRVSPDGQHVVTAINTQLYVANFTDPRFLQVFYPTRGILAWYDKASGRMQHLPGADDPRYVHTGATWSPDGKYLVFSRAEAREAYPEGRKLAEYANDPNETPIQYDLYRIPFNAGRGGLAEPIAGASGNGMSNSFPKVSPDGRWIVFVQCHNGQLMRPDSRLYIVPAQGGEARRMRCNLPRMNSWHSFSPNGRWLVFTSKSPSIYTQMYLTHLDEEGRDSPAILIENATAANRAVNIPEFVNVPSDGLLKIDVPAAEQFRYFDSGRELAKAGSSDRAIVEFDKALEIDPDYAEAHNSLGMALAACGKTGEAITHYRKALESKPDFTEAHNNLGITLAACGRLDEAIAHYRQALEIQPDSYSTQNNLGIALVDRGQIDEALAHFHQALELKPDYAAAHNNLGFALAGRGQLDEAIVHYRKALEIQPDYAEACDNLAMALDKTGRAVEAIVEYRKALEVRPGNVPTHIHLADALASRGQLDLAVAEYAKALEIEPRSVAAHNNLGFALAGLGRADEAIAHYQKALELRPGYAAAHNNLGLALASRGQIDEAIAHYRKALEIRPDYAEAHNNLGVALASGGGNMAEAIVHFQKALEIKPDYIGARQNLEHARGKR